MRYELKEFIMLVATLNVSYLSVTGNADPSAKSLLEASEGFRAQNESLRQRN